MLLIEACAENFTNVPIAIANGAKRIELCDNLSVGGTTPSRGVMAETIKYAHEHDVLVMIMIRPRSGNFVYNDTEIKIMETDIFAAQELGADGVVFGALTDDNNLDIETMELLMAASNGMETVFHMAFDEMDDKQQREAINWFKENDLTRILTHGGLPNSGIAANLNKISETLANATPEVQVIAGGGINWENYESIAKDTGINQFHGTAFAEHK